MDSYFDIKALPNPEIPPLTVVAHLMQQLHQILPKYAGEIGLDFPGYRKKQGLGAVIRLLGTHEAIKRINEKVTNTPDIAGYGMITPLEQVPSSVSKFARFSRVHMKGNSRLTRLKNRHLARGTWTDELAMAAQGKFNEVIDLPYVNLLSGSTGQHFNLFISRVTVKHPIDGAFNGYGLSIDNLATVPQF